MVSAGFTPWDDDEKPEALRVSPERLAEFDRLMAEGGMEAIMAKLNDDKNPDYPTRT